MGFDPKVINLVVVVVVIVVVVIATVVGSVVNLLMIFENLGQTDKHTHSSVYRVAPQLKSLLILPFSCPNVQKIN